MTDADYKSLPKDRRPLDTRSNPSEFSQFTRHSNSVDSYGPHRGPSSSATTPSHNVTIRSSKHHQASESDLIESNINLDTDGRGGPQSVAAVRLLSTLRSTFEAAEGLPYDALKEVYKVTNLFLQSTEWKLSHPHEESKPLRRSLSRAGPDEWQDVDFDGNGAAQEKYTSTLDEYLSKVGDLDIARSRYGQFVREMNETRERLRIFGGKGASGSTRDEINANDLEIGYLQDAQKHVENLQELYEDVKVWEEKCFEENSLNKFRDYEEDHVVYLDTGGDRERYIHSFMKPSPDWHRRRDNKEFEILMAGLPLPPQPPQPPPPPPSSRRRLETLRSPCSSASSVSIETQAPPILSDQTIIAPIEINPSQGDVEEKASPSIEKVFLPQNPFFEPQSIATEAGKASMSIESDSELLPALDLLQCPLPISVNPGAEIQASASSGKLSTDSSRDTEIEELKYDGLRMPLTLTELSATLYDIEEDSGPVALVVQKAIQTELKAKALLGPASGSQVYSIIYDTSWELPIFFAAHAPPESSLGSLLTLTMGGPTDEPYATSCHEYISETWGSLGILVLEAVEDMLRGSNRGEAKYEQTSLKITEDQGSVRRRKLTAYQTEPISATDGYITNARLYVEGPFQDQVSIATAFTWLCCAIRISPNGIKLSPATIKNCNTGTAGDAQIAISLPSLLEPSLSDSYSCWHKLFNCQAIASGFPVPERRKGRGLEISYTNMIGLAQAFNMTRIYDGLVAEGLRTVLIPTKELDEVGGPAIQWHLELKPLDESNPEFTSFSILSPETYSNIYAGSLYQELDVGKLSNRRAFLGWVPNAVTRAGTTESYTNFDRSGLPPINASRRIWTKGTNVSLGFTPITLTGTVSATFASVTPAILGIEAPTLTMALKNAAERQHAVIYDNVANVAWHLSRASLILYIAHIFIDRRREKAHKSSIQARPRCVPPYPKPSPDGGKSAFEAISGGIEWEIPAESDSVEPLSHPHTLCWLIKKIVFALRTVEQGLTSTRTEAAKCGKMAPGSILGVELLDVALFESQILIKEKEVNQAWAHITETEPLVFFSGHLRQLIVPSREVYSDKSLCKPWLRVPRNENFLVATGHTIIHLLKDCTIEGMPRLGKSIQWTFDDDRPLFALHPHDKKTRCRHLQTLRSTERHDLIAESQVLEQIENQKNAAFIFDGSGKVPEPASEYGHHFYNLQNGPVLDLRSRSPEALLPLSVTPKPNDSIAIPSIYRFSKDSNSSPNDQDHRAHSKEEDISHTMSPRAQVSRPLLGDYTEGLRFGKETSDNNSRNPSTRRLEQTSSNLTNGTQQPSIVPRGYETAKTIETTHASEGLATTDASHTIAVSSTISADLQRAAAKPCLTEAKVGFADTNTLPSSFNPVSISDPNRIYIMSPEVVSNSGKGKGKEKEGDRRRASRGNHVAGELPSVKAKGKEKDRDDHRAARESSIVDERGGDSREKHKPHRQNKHGTQDQGKKSRR